ncbi:MAG: hypothetical protein ABIO95_06790 [Bdellovibrionota bacterium]
MGTKFRTLAFLPALMAFDTTRHLMESWPQVADRNEIAAEAPSATAPKKIRAQVEEVRSLLQDLLDSLKTSDDPACRDTAGLAMALLSERFDKQTPFFLACSGSCRSTGARLEEFVDALRSLESELGQCRRTQTLSKWLFERESGLKGSFGAQETVFVNPHGFPVGTSSVREVSSKFDFGLAGTYRSDRSWHSVEGTTSFAVFQKSVSELDYGVKQDNVVQLGSQAFRFSVALDKKGEWAWVRQARTSHDIQDVVAGWRLVPGSSRALEILAHFHTDAWRPADWSRRILGIETNYVITESLHDDLKLKGSLSREALKGLEGALWVTRAGVVYERKGSSFSSAHLTLGLQDRRMKDFGAGLWPDFEIELEGKDFFVSGLHPNFGLSLSPDSTPWSPHTLMAKSHWGLRYSRGNFEMPATFAVGEDFHRSPLSGHRDDRKLELTMSPAYKFSESLAVSLPIRVTRFWILKSDLDPASVTLNYPSNSYRDFEATMRLQYDF